MIEYPDDVKRVKDEMDLHAVAHGEGYAVFSLQTGTPVTHDLYPSRGHARKFAERKTTDALLILQVQPDGMLYKEAEAVLKYERALFAAGFRTPDTLETEENSGILSMPHNRHDRRAMAKQLLTGKPIIPGDVPYGNLPLNQFRRR